VYSVQPAVEKSPSFETRKRDRRERVMQWDEVIFRGIMRTCPVKLTYVVSVLAVPVRRLHLAHEICSSLINQTAEMDRSQRRSQRRVRDLDANPADGFLFWAVPTRSFSPRSSSISGARGLLFFSLYLPRSALEQVKWAAVPRSRLRAMPVRRIE
jgi:hypothetical protein